MCPDTSHQISASTQQRSFRPDQISYENECRIWPKLKDTLTNEISAPRLYSRRQRSPHVFHFVRTFGTFHHQSASRGPSQDDSDRRHRPEAGGTGHCRSSKGGDTSHRRTWGRGGTFRHQSASRGSSQGGTDRRHFLEADDTDHRRNASDDSSRGDTSRHRSGRGGTLRRQSASRRSSRGIDCCRRPKVDGIGHYCNSEADDIDHRRDAADDFSQNDTSHRHTVVA